MRVILGIFYVTMVLGGYAVELIFGGFGLVPDHGQAEVVQEIIQWNYTTWLNIVALLLSAVLLARFFRTGGREMLAMMDGSPDDMAMGDEHQDGHHDMHQDG